ncbi:MAG TPA: c-type cytochrome [Pyrinomonadaceae bacterium]|jgi:hypothetical protein
MKAKIKIVVTLAFSLLALVFFEPNPAVTQTMQIETAGQKFKNIKVLNEMPADQMGKVMNLMSASLGVNCNFCHSSEEDFAKDDNEHKQTAREMLKMTFALNKNYFNGRIEVSCNTCHNGKSHPQSVPNLNSIAAENARPKQPEMKPAIEQIVEKYEQAVGGKANFDKINSRYIKASRIEPNGKSEPEEIWQKGNKLLIVTTYSQAVVSEAFDGANAWKRANEHSIPLKADEAEQIRRGAELFASANLKAIYPKMEFGAIEKINGREVYQVRAATANGGRERLYFDRETGLLARRTASVPTILGNFVYQVDYSDYKDFGGVKLPATTRFAVPNISWTRKISEVKNNAAIEDAKFNQPAK